MPPEHLLPPSKHVQDMGTLTLRLPNERHERLKTLAARRGVSLNRFFEELSTRALAEFEVETRFRARAAHGDPQAGLALLDRLERHFSGEAVTK